MKTVQISVDLLDRLVEAAFDSQSRNQAGIEGQAILDTIKNNDPIQIRIEPNELGMFSELKEVFYHISEQYRIKDRLGNGCNRSFKKEHDDIPVEVEFFRMNDFNGNDDIVTVKYGDYKHEYSVLFVRTATDEQLAAHFAYCLGMYK